MNTYSLELTEAEMDVLRGAIKAANEEGLLGRRFSDYYGPFTDEARAALDTLLPKLGLRWPTTDSYEIELST